MRKGYIVDVLISFDIQEFVKKGAKVIEFYEGVVYWDNFEKSLFKNVIEKLLALRQKKRWAKRFDASFG